MIYIKNVNDCIVAQAKKIKHEHPDQLVCIFTATAIDET